MEDFAKQYHACNPTLTDTADAVYAVAFSILLLHTDAHNKNVRQKMAKDTFVRRTKIIEGGESVPSEILDIMYDNIVYSEFTYADNNTDPFGNHKLVSEKSSSSWFTKLKGDTDLSMQMPKMEQLMPPINTFKYKGSEAPINIMDVHLALIKSRSLCLGGVRSRQHAEMPGNNTNTYSVRVTKAGLLDRKYDLQHGGKRASARGWRQFGMILSGSQIIFFADISSFQSWFGSDPTPTVAVTSMDDMNANYTSHAMATPRRNSSYPMFTPPTHGQGNRPTTPTDSGHATTNNPTYPFRYHASQGSTSSTLSSVAPTMSSFSSLTSSVSFHPALGNSTFSSVTSHGTSILRPVQIISLNNAICIYDEAYTKYPHVFRLITADKQQFLIRAESKKDMEDWMLKINYAATVKTTGVRFRPSSRQRRATQGETDHPIQNITREEKAKAKICELTDAITKITRQLDRENQLRENLMVLTPYQKSTKDRLLMFAETVGKRIQEYRVGLQQYTCYREFLNCELAWWSSEHKVRKLSASLPICDRGSIMLQPYSSSAMLRISSTSPSVPVPSPDHLLPGNEGKDSIHIPRRTSSLFKFNPYSFDDEPSSIHDVPCSEKPSAPPATLSEQEVDPPNAEHRRLSLPHVAPLSFPKHFMDKLIGSSPVDKKSADKDSAQEHVRSETHSPLSHSDDDKKLRPQKNSTTKVAEMEKSIRRRSMSNPIVPKHLIRMMTSQSDTVNKANLLTIPNIKPNKTANRERSSSTASSIRDDDDSVIIVNESEEDLTEKVQQE
ncbi:uncharacterized protein BYT42DRAFT_322581 [Radiomyces spectabilis]|uniref:uncharacterized protein n=1 Tax=Radiomyces spectabilis TaxID=64574 RepID=UPI00221F3365|nr:uncharacterized protein BYT42DRAFT_322581 [Radiomyces spectabilis]KAI8379316.1 hypothetical protein BYT42DRAFT_322581 [Radiomyces spectabilis]